MKKILTFSLSEWKPAMGGRGLWAAAWRRLPEAEQWWTGAGVTYKLPHCCGHWCHRRGERRRQTERKRLRKEETGFFSVPNSCVFPSFACIPQGMARLNLARFKHTYFKSMTDFSYDRLPRCYFPPLPAATVYLNELCTLSCPTVPLWL